MKLLPKLALSGLLAGSLSLLSSSAQAQVTININPPSWGPSTPTGTEYYYIPEAKSYYDLRAQRYIVLQNGQWVRVANLSGYDQRNFHPVVLDYRGSQPWSQYSRHRQLYPASLPPGQVKRLESGKGLPPGQAKKVYGGHPGNGNGKGNGKGKH
ncbi:MULTISPECIES: hypothetical protein [Hymenobacter]|nr:MULTISPECIES: hypothetical protein [Hymenobacter]